jgi:NAD(P)-dependent dehydrogenase (short-subunit alcohol dehydrogenase family)
MIARIPMRRTGSPQDLDAPFRMLALAESSYMTGTIITIDGGHSSNAL